MVVEIEMQVSENQMIYGICICLNSDYLANSNHIGYNNNKIKKEQSISAHARIEVLVSNKEFYNEMMDFFRAFFRSTFKPNTYRYK